MRPRTEVAIAVASLAAVLALAGGAGLRSRNVGDLDPRASSLLDGPHGLKGLAEVIEAAGGTVIRWRGPSARLDERVPASATLVVADPASRFTPGEVASFFGRPRNALLAGTAAGDLMRCFGHAVSRTVLDSSRVQRPGEDRAGGPWTHARLRALPSGARTLPADPAEDGDERVAPCPVALIGRTDTLLVDRNGAPVAIRVWHDTAGTSAVLLADAGLLSNAALRSSPLAPYLVGVVLAARDTVIFDEVHQGFGPQGSLGRTVLAWSAQAPAGWLLWQLGAVALLVFLSGAVRFGPVAPPVAGRRRSSVEHVKALATALAAARGHDVAIAAIVRGLRRRLQDAAGSRAAGRAGGDWSAWAQGLSRSAPNAAVRGGAAGLATLAQPGQPDTAVRAAANIVEDVWEALHH